MSDDVQNDLQTEEALVPHDDHAEMALLGVWLNDDPKSSCYLQTKIPAEWFWRQEHADIARAIDAVVSSGEQADSVTVGAELKRQGGQRKLDSVGGYPYLEELIDRCCTKTNAETHAAIIKEMWQRRKWAGVSKDAYYQCFNLSLPLASIRENMSQVLVEVDGHEKGGQKMSDLVQEELFRVLDRDQLKAERESWPRSRIASLDSIIDGFQPGRLGILAGYPGIGKSSLAAWIVLKNAACDRHIHCAFVSLEMPWKEVVQRLAAGESGLENGEIDRENVSKQKQEDYRAALNTFYDLPVWIVDSTRCQAREDEVLNAVQQAAVVDGCKLIVVDYIQLIQANKGNLTRAEELSRLAARLKTTAVRLNVYILALSQLTREAAKAARAGERVPDMQDLKDSSGLEQTADEIIVLGAEVDKKGMSSTDDRVSIVCNVVKHRSGRPGECLVAFDKQHQTWSSTGGAPALEEGKHGPV